MLHLKANQTALKHVTKSDTEMATVGFLHSPSLSYQHILPIKLIIFHLLCVAHSKTSTRLLITMKRT